MTALDTLRRPEHTGENRCWPCTVVNLVIVVVVAALAGVAFAPLGPLVLLAGGSLVYLRGYVVPGTPRFAPRLVEPLPFDIGPEKPDRVESGSIADGVSRETTDDDELVRETAADGSGERVDEAGEYVDPGSDYLDAGSDDAADPEALLAALLEAGVLVEAGEDLRLADDYREAFEERMADLRDLPESALADRAAAAAGDDLDGEVHGERIRIAGDHPVWLSRPVAIAETAAAETLAAFDVPSGIGAAAARPLRTFVRTCPVCGGDVAETVRRNCCGGPGGVQRDPDLPVLACEECSALVFEFDPE
ncbi:hypothetical protein [Halorubrum sp. F4]|uniref:hypothetical protein n=1 Tax=Halorubrum sp. F4 TaxID=2989715 RepID=UPI002480A870|nr:hypothetical protein [Halorubrum sp. F4]